MITGFISVDSDEFELGTYRCTRLYITRDDDKDSHHTFASGDFPTDYTAASARAIEQKCDHVSLSSSVFDFMRLEGYEFIEGFNDE